MELGYRAGVPEHNTFLKHFLAVPQHIDTEGWDVISPELEDAHTYVHNLHQRITNLVESVWLCAPGIGHNTLSQQCEQLLHLTTRWLAAEREFFALVDQGSTEAYDNAISAGSLSWQTPSE